MKTTYTINSPIGVLCLKEEEGYLVGLQLDHSKAPSSQAPSPLLKEAATQLKEYFEGTRTTFHLPLRAEGTVFQKKVWIALQDIPYGETRSYGDIAKVIGQPKASRAVGGANNRNPIMIIVPCHRVVGVNGAMVGFGAGIEVKQYLLDLERRGAL